MEITRRNLLRIGTAAAVTSALPAAAPAAPQVQPDAVEKMLAKPLDDAGKARLRAAVLGVNAVTAARLAVKLPEGSEPCTVFIPSPKEVR